MKTLIYGNAIKIATVVFAVAVGLLAAACSDDEELNYVDTTFSTRAADVLDNSWEIIRENTVIPVFCEFEYVGNDSLHNINCTVNIKYSYYGSTNHNGNKILIDSYDKSKIDTVYMGRTPCFSHSHHVSLTVPMIGKKDNNLYRCDKSFGIQ